MNSGKKIYSISASFVLLAFVLSVSIAVAEENLTDPCAGISCNTPPPNECIDLKTPKIYNSVGTCSSGQCAYTFSTSQCGSKTLTCPDGYVASCHELCSGGVCSSCTTDCSGHQSVDKCAGVICNSFTLTCFDGFVASCTPKCDSLTGVCGTCTPDCSGHRGSNSTAVCNNYVREEIEQCDGSDLAGQTCQSRGFAGGTLKCNMGCTFDTSGCTSTTAVATAVCGNGVCESGEDFYNCPSDCQQQTCPLLTQPNPDFCKDGNIVKKTDDKGCVVSYDCQRLTSACPIYTEPECPGGVKVSGGTDANGCKLPTTCCGDKICSGRESAQICESDCTGGTAINCANVVICISSDGCCPSGCSATQDKDCAAQIPTGQRCPDGSTVKCGYVGETYRCDPCPIPTQNIQQGCRQESDPSTGIVRMICNMICPDSQEMVDAQMYAAKQKCLLYNGASVQRVDGRGCNYMDCQFGTVPTSPMSISPVYCPSPSQIDDTTTKCKAMNIEPMFSFENGCKVVKCGEQKPVGCGLVPGPERERIEAECAAKGMGTIKEFDQNGCQVIRCGSQGECSKDPPQEAFEKCRAEGGEMIINRDPNGCAFSKCIMRGDERDVYVEDIKEMPDSSELLSIAFKLEELKMDFDKLAQKTDDIANYYKSTGSTEEQRFRRVSDMFDAAKDKVDEIKTKLRNKLQTLTKDDLLEIKSDIRYVKDVMLKDVVYVMLSNSDEVKEVISQPLVSQAAQVSEEGSCRSDGACFDRAFRVCRSTVFSSQDASSNGTQPTIIIMGMKDNYCMVKITIPNSQGPPAGAIPGISPPYEMTCKFTTYALGTQQFSGGEEAFKKYCEGNLLQLMSTFATRAPQQAIQQQQVQPVQPTETQPATSASGGGGGTSVPTTTTSTQTIRTGPCAGCLNNGICDQGECSDCPDCYVKK